MQKISLGCGGAVTAARILQAAKLAEGVQSVLDGLMNRHDAQFNETNINPPPAYRLLYPPNRRMGSIGTIGTAAALPVSLQQRKCLPQVDTAG